MKNAKKFNFATPYNGVARIRFEKVTDSTLTVPDLSMDIRTILKRFASGLPVNTTSRSQETGGDETFDDLQPDPRKMDISERYAYAKAAVEEVKATRARKKAEDDARAKRAAERMKDQEEAVKWFKESKNKKDPSSPPPPTQPGNTGQH